MREVWLRPNRRALLLSMIPPLILALLGAVLGGTAWRLWHSPPLAVLGALLAGLGLLGVAGLARMMWLPRLAYEEESLVVYLGRGGPQRVPIDFVEIFFRGQGPSMLPRQWGQSPTSESEARNVVVRLADAEPDWHRRPTHPWLGSWCDGYITVRGTWCEPLTQEVFERLNRRLVEVHRQRKQNRHRQETQKREEA